MANVLQDVKKRPEAVLGDFSRPDPLVTFSKDDFTHTYGSKWKQRYFKQIGDDFVVMPAQWDVQNKQWRPYLRQGRDGVVDGFLSGGTGQAAYRAVV